MNKTISINISGQAFFIDEFAYEKLKQYLEDIRRHFSSSEGGEEIMSDIESRIAEIFSNALAKTRSVVLMEDVEKMIGIMGKPEDFMDGSEGRHQSSEQETSGEIPTGNSRNRRIYRNPDDKILGGVCGGVAAYFNMDPVWLRLAFVAAMLLAGTGVLFYLVLWIVIPIAKTTAQKLEMKGEPVNISNIEKNIKEEMEEIEKRFKSYSSNAGQTIRQQYAPGLRGILQKVIDALSNLAQYLAKGVVKFIGLFLVIFGIIMMLTVMAATFGGKTWVNINEQSLQSMNLNDLMLRVFNDPSQLFLAKAGLLLSFGIPVLLITYLGLRIVLKIKEKKKWVNISALILWIVGIVVCLSVAGELYADFSQRSTVKEKVSIAAPDSSVFYLKAKQMVSDWDEEDAEENGWHIKLNEDQSMRIFYPGLRIVKSSTDSFNLFISRRARGEVNKEATIRAKEIQYSFSQKDSVLLLDSYYELAKSEKWRGQQVRITLEVPVGKSIFIDKSVANMLDDVDNIGNTMDHDMVNRRWIMSPQGLKCIDCSGLIDEKDKRLEKEIETEIREELNQDW